MRPRKGQMLYVLPQATLLQHVLRTPEVYVVPRSSGKILIGATVEDVGFDKSVDPSAIQQLAHRRRKISAGTRFRANHAELGGLAAWHA